jgi:hypothetical protein
VRRPYLIALSLAATAIATFSVPPAGAQTDGGGVQVSTRGVGRPSGAGMGTKAALNNPKCNAGAVAGWGSFPMVTTTGGPYCVRPAPKNNGGATSRGVTATTVKVVVVLPWPQSNGTGATNDTGSVNRATGGRPSVQAVILDTWAALSHVYETWGRTVEFTFVTASGLDETSQRADVVKVEQEKPMFVVNTDARGLDVLATTLAKDKYVVYSYSTTPDQAASLAPYLWGLFNSEANQVNAGEFVGKQLVGGKAEFAGDDSMHSQPRKFGMVYATGTNLDSFTSTFKKYKGALATPALGYAANGSPLGDPVTADEAAPNIITKLKAAGVTSVILFTDIAMTGSLTKAATKQEYKPEWIITGAQYQDVTILARNYDQDQWAHAFGIANLPPAIKTTGSTAASGLADWYWGPTQGSISAVPQSMVTWLANAIMYAGPRLTPRTVAQGQFGVPGRGGYAWNDVTSTQTGFGRTSGLPQPSYLSMGVDYAPIWYDAQTVGPSNGLYNIAKGVNWYVDGGKRYIAGTWPTKKFNFFQKNGAVVEVQVDSTIAGTPVACTGCPSSGGPGSPSAA